MPQRACDRTLHTFTNSLDHLLLARNRSPYLYSRNGTGMRAMETKPKILVPQGTPTLWYKGLTTNGNAPAKHDRRNVFAATADAAYR